jgi:hypothetical protein
VRFTSKRCLGRTGAVRHNPADPHATCWGLILKECWLVYRIPALSHDAHAGSQSQPHLTSQSANPLLNPCGHVDTMKVQYCECSRHVTENNMRHGQAVTRPPVLRSVTQYTTRLCGPVTSITRHFRITNIHLFRCLSYKSIHSLFRSE